MIEVEEREVFFTKQLGLEICVCYYSLNRVSIQSLSGLDCRRLSGATHEPLKHSSQAKEM